MEKYTRFLRLNLFAGFLAIFITLAACKPEDQEVLPQQTCDTQATIKVLPDCGGLVLVLKNAQKLIPINAISLPPTPSGLKQFKINGFGVQEGQQVIIGFTKKAEASDSCLKGAPLVEVTCIVGYQIQS